MEALQLAQMLADLSNLNAGDSQSAERLVSANKIVAQQPLETTAASTAATTTSTPVPHTARTAGAPTPFDSYIGRRLLSSSASATSSFPGTPHGETDCDSEHASSLIALYELRAKLKQYNDSNSLQQAREKIAALSARQKQSHITTAPSSATPSSSTSQPHPPGRRYSQHAYQRT